MVGMGLESLTNGAPVNGNQSEDWINKYLPVANSTQPFWHRDVHELEDHRSTDELPAHSDIVIIGAGYAGIATAYHLTQGQGSDTNQRSIAVLEARGVCSGATGRNGGHLRPDLYGHIPTYIARAGIEAGAELARFEIAHVHAIKKVIEKENIDCDFTLARSIDVWCNEDAAKKAKEVYDQMVAHELDYMDDVFFTYGKQAEGISGVKGAKACASYTAGTIWPYKFILHLTKIILATNQVNLQTHTPVKSVTPDPKGGFIVKTDRGSMHATKVVHASNGYVSGLLPEYEKNIVPCKGICCRIVVPEDTIGPLLNNSYINRTDDGVLSYLIPRSDGSIIVGGSSSVFKPYKDQWYNNVDDSVTIEASKDYYENYMQNTYRGWETSGATIDKVWTGVMGYSYDSNPHIGHVPDKPGELINAGFNGHGMPVIWLASEGIAKMINEGIPFEKTGMPKLFKTTKERIVRAQNGREEDGDILGTGSFPATKQ